MRHFIKVLGAGLLCAGLATGGSAPARAYEFLLTLDNVTFSDGGTASGNLDIDTYGYITGSTVVTAAGTSGSYPGENYAWPGASTAPALYSGGTIVSLIPSGTSGYVLDLVLATGITGAMTGSDAIVGGYEECLKFNGCAGGVAEYSERSIVLTSGASLDVAEPASLTLLTTGLLALGWGRRRRDRTASLSPEAHAA